MFELLFKEHLLPRTFKNRPIWSHCFWVLSGLAISLLAVYSNDPGLNLAAVNSFFREMWFEESEMKQKEAAKVGPLFQ